MLVALESRPLNPRPSQDNARAYHDQDFEEVRASQDKDQDSCGICLNSWLRRLGKNAVNSKETRPRPWICSLETGLESYYNLPPGNPHSGSHCLALYGFSCWLPKTWWVPSVCLYVAVIIRSNEDAQLLLPCFINCESGKQVHIRTHPATFPGQSVAVLTISAWFRTFEGGLQKVLHTSSRNPLKTMKSPAD